MHSGEATRCGQSGLHVQTAPHSLHWRGPTRLRDEIGCAVPSYHCRCAGTPQGCVHCTGNSTHAWSMRPHALAKITQGGSTTQTSRRSGPQIQGILISRTSEHSDFAPNCSCAKRRLGDAAVNIHPIRTNVTPTTAKARSHTGPKHVFFTGFAAHQIQMSKQAYLGIEQH
jgi:hypothetical protein